MSVNATDPDGTWETSSGTAPVAGLASSEHYSGHDDDVGYVRRPGAALGESEAARCTCQMESSKLEDGEGRAEAA